MLDIEAIRRYSPAPDLLRGRVIAITGAGDGIGRALALGAARCGAQLVLMGRNVRRLEALEAEIAALWPAGAAGREASIAPSISRRPWQAITTGWPRP